MSNSTTIHKTYKYRLYRNDKRDKYLQQQINIAGTVWNHVLALQNRYYRLTGKYIDLSTMRKHIAYLRMHNQKYSFWKSITAQSTQDILQRLDDAYQRFFKKVSKAPPKYKKVRQRKSFTLAQNGWKLLDGNKIRIGEYEYKYVKHRPLNGVIKTLTIKRDVANRLWLCFNVQEDIETPIQVVSRNTAGFDFGLKTFLVDHTGQTCKSEQFGLKASKQIRSIQSKKDKKVRCSNNRKNAAKWLARTSIRIADKRRDAHYKLAHRLCDKFDVLYFEDLNLAGMKSRYGRKISDLAFGQFMQIVKEVAFRRGKQVVQIGRFELTTGKCSVCKHEQKLELRDRIFACKNCGLIIDRDHNAAINIRNVGASTYTGLEVVRRDPKKLRRFAKKVSDQKSTNAS